jgi:hypothetical protein
MHRTKQEVISQIRDAFRGVVLGSGVGLFEGRALDDYADAATRTACRDEDERHHWEDIPVEDLNHYDSSLSFFDAEGMRFHLPAYLIAELEGTYRASMVFYLTECDFETLMQKLVLLSKAQREAVREFLMFVVDQPEHKSDRAAIRRALGEYWRGGEDNEES